MSASLHDIQSTRPSPWAPGSVIGGKYRLTTPIGSGGMGQVWRAEHTSLGTTVAIKLVDLTTSQNPQETLARFLHEARAAAKLKTPNVVQTIDHGAQGHVAYIVMELLEGESLAKRLSRTRSLPASDTVRIFREMARAIDKAHTQGIVHRDLKPENVFLALEDGREVVKILDFGIAKTTEGGHDPHLKTHAGTVLGTPAYMSPEQVLGKAIDARSDLWQLAVIGFECVTGVRAFQGQTLGELFMRICTAPLPVPSQVTKVPLGFDAWFARAAQREPKDRFQTSRELVESLAAVLLRAPVVGPATVPLGSMLERPPEVDLTGRNAAWSSGAPRPSPARKMLTIVAAILPILAAGAVGAVWIIKSKADAKNPDAHPATSVQAPNAPPTTPSAVPQANPTTPPSVVPANAADAGAPPPPSGTPDAGKAPVKGTLPKQKDDLGF